MNTIKSVIDAINSNDYYTAKLWEQGGKSRVYVTYDGKDIGYFDSSWDGCGTIGCLITKRQGTIADFVRKALKEVA